MAKTQGPVNSFGNVHFRIGSRGLKNDLEEEKNLTDHTKNYVHFIHESYIYQDYKEKYNINGDVFNNKTT